MTPRVTVAIPTRNRGELLKESLRSIFLQDIELEVILIRLAGDAELPTVLEASDPRISAIVECEHSPIAGAGFNLISEYVNSNWLLHWSDDDLLVPGSLELLVDLAEQYGADSLGGRFINIGPSDRVEDVSPADRNRRTVVKALTWRDVIGPYASLPMPGWALFRTEIALEVRWQEERGARSPLDRYFALEAFARCAKAFSSDLTFLAYRSHPQQITKSLQTEEILANYYEWQNWARTEFPMFRSAGMQRRLRAEESFLQAEINYRLGRPWTVGYNALKTGWNLPRASTKVDWWTMLGYSLYRGSISALSGIKAKATGSSRLSTRPTTQQVREILCETQEDGDVRLSSEADS